ncbi:uncharacterized protein BKA55DRAFT_4941 [Fusarium redolens]|uniref:Uncharacterized protein n=1 Tax=Fusarium redolens TaxID=48865 RepID=A0A9P9R8U6_FUSRE|nr:uncharacterized protein BKA55DRAFT_4941 [Fusarium redolens]KAH7269320.1 hypothetical protein BKA55DRAFT_4941 [Fusarium redolens]
MCCDTLYRGYPGMSAVHIHLYYFRNRFRRMLMYVQLSPSAISVAIDISFDGYADHMFITIVVMMMISVAGAFNSGTLMCSAFDPGAPSPLVQDSTLSGIENWESSWPAADEFLSAKRLDR